MTNWLRGVINRVSGHYSEFFVSTIREGDTNYLSLKVRFRKSSNNEPSSEELRNGLSVPAGAEFLVLMADESVISLYSTEATTANTRYERDEDKYVINSGVVLRYGLDASTLDALSSQDATDVRFAATSGRLGFVNRHGTVDFVITKKSRGNFKQAIRCLQQHGAEEQG